MWNTTIYLFCDRPLATLPPLSHFASEYKGASSMDHRERGFHAQGAYPHMCGMRTSCIETVRVRQEEEAKKQNNNLNETAASSQRDSCSLSARQLLPLSETAAV